MAKFYCLFLKIKFKTLKTGVLGFWGAIAYRTKHVQKTLRIASRVIRCGEVLLEEGT